jgi:CubicO group peptidase (beta-lactamase class C family)
MTPAAAADDWKYGYQWWLLPYPGQPDRLVWAALGYGGQRLLLFPQENLVAVWTGWNLYGRPSLGVEHTLERLLQAVR